MNRVYVSVWQDGDTFFHVAFTCDAACYHKNHLVAHNISDALADKIRERENLFKVLSQGVYDPNYYVLRELPTELREEVEDVLADLGLFGDSFYWMASPRAFIRWAIRDFPHLNQPWMAYANQVLDSRGLGRA